MPFIRRKAPGGEGGVPKHRRRSLLPVQSDRVSSIPVAPLLIRVPPVIADQVFALLRDVLRHFSQEVQWIEDLEVALRTGEQIITVWYTVRTVRHAACESLPNSERS